MAAPTDPVTRSDLARDLTSLGLRRGGAVMVHAAVSKVGRLLGGPDDLIAALTSAIGPDGTVLAYTDWGVGYDHLLDGTGRVLPRWRSDLPAFDPATSRADRDHGVFAEFLRTSGGALRSRNPGASCAAVGARAAEFTDDHPYDYGYGAGSPFARLVDARGQVLMLGAPLDTMTLLHHAEHIADIPGKRLRRYEAPLATPEGRVWRVIEEYETGVPVVEGLAPDYFAGIVDAYLATGKGQRGRVGHADSVLADAADIVAFAVGWLERRFGG